MESKKRTIVHGIENVVVKNITATLQPRIDEVIVETLSSINVPICLNILEVSVREEACDKSSDRDIWENAREISMKFVESQNDFENIVKMDVENIIRVDIEAVVERNISPKKVCMDIVGTKVSPRVNALRRIAENDIAENLHDISVPISLSILEVDVRGMICDKGIDNDIMENSRKINVKSCEKFTEKDVQTTMKDVETTKKDIETIVGRYVSPKEDLKVINERRGISKENIENATNTNQTTTLGNVADIKKPDLTGIAEDIKKDIQQIALEKVSNKGSIEVNELIRFIKEESQNLPKIIEKSIKKSFMKEIRKVIMNNIENTVINENIDILWVIGSIERTILENKGFIERIEKAVTGPIVLNIVKENCKRFCKKNHVDFIRENIEYLLIEAAVVAIANRAKLIQG